MNSTSVNDINQEVYKRFPEFRGVKPKQQKLDRNTLFLYQTEVRLPDDHAIQRSVRVVVNEQGEIIKISTSR